MNAGGGQPAVVDDIQPVLELRDIKAGYGRTEVLRGISMKVRPGSVTAVLGPNGAGKTTLLRVASGLVRPSTGRVSVNGEDVTRLPPHRRVRKGLCHVPEGRAVFRNLTVGENLRMMLPAWVDQTRRSNALEIFPALADRTDQMAGTMSGGQQQMLALARAYLSNPVVVILDEVSMGLAPLVIDEIFDSLSRLRSSGAALLLVEQYVHRALAIADQVVLMDRGTASFTGSPDALDEDAIVAAYLGGTKPSLTGFQ